MSSQSIKDQANITSSSLETTLFPASFLSEYEIKDFFISHSREDNLWARWVAWQLEEANYSVILPEWDFRAGNSIVRQTQIAITKVRCTIALLSPNYFNASSTQFIRDLLIKRNMGNRHRIIPVCVRECDFEFKALLESVKCLNLVELNETEARVKLLMEIRGGRVKPVKPPLYPGSDIESEQEATQIVSIRPFLQEQSYHTAFRHLEILFSYSNQDEAIKRELETHLQTLKRRYSFAIWHEGCINAGGEVEKEINDHLETAQIVLLLISHNFLASEYCYNIEMKQAVARHDRGETIVVPIILRPCLWEKAPFGKLKVLPIGGKAITSFTVNREKIYLEIIKEIEMIINRISVINPLV